MKNKPVKFEKRIFHKEKVYLKLSDVVKALGYSSKQKFIDEHDKDVVSLSGIGQCVAETTFNDLLSNDPVAFSNQGQLEVTKVETLRSKIDSVIGFQPLKFMLFGNYLTMMAAMTGCKSEEEYIITHEIPKEKRKALEELIRDNDSNPNYTKMIEYINDKERFDLEHIRSFNLDVQYLSSIDCTGKTDLDVFVCGHGVFCHITDFGDYELWNDMYRDDKGDIILPWCNYDLQNSEEVLVNLSQTNIDRDFSKYNAVDNMIWCIENLAVTGLEDYEYAVFDYDNDAGIRFSMSAELLVKLIKPDTISTIYTDTILDIVTEKYITEVDADTVLVE
ncbi:MAG: hypothetical protein PHW34_14075 [Hespellia sp.]|nr:hypothetical protein [Hespellia sp.]